MSGMTIKQHARARFFSLIDQRNQAAEFRFWSLWLALSVQLHAAKADVPRALWRFAK